MYQSIADVLRRSPQCVNVHKHRGILATSVKARRRRLFEAACAPCRCPSASPASAACPGPPCRAPRPLAGAAPSPADPGAGVALVSGTAATGSRRCRLRTCARAPDYLNVHKVEGDLCSAAGSKAQQLRRTLVSRAPGPLCEILAMLRLCCALCHPALHSHTQRQAGWRECQLLRLPFLPVVRQETRASDESWKAQCSSAPDK